MSEIVPGGPDDYDSYRRVSEYLHDLATRVAAQKAWHERHPEWPDVLAMWRESDELNAVLEEDPYPDTRDIFTSALLADILTLCVSAFERSHHPSRLF